MLDPKLSALLHPKWAELTEPHPSVIEPVRRQDARNLAALMLFLAAILLPIVPVVMAIFGAQLIAVLAFLRLATYSSTVCRVGRIR